MSAGDREVEVRFEKGTAHVGVGNLDALVTCAFKRPML